MRLRTEHYRGISIAFIQKGLAHRQLVVGKWLHNGNIRQIQSPTKVDAFNAIRKIIDRVR